VKSLARLLRPLGVPLSVAFAVGIVGWAGLVLDIGTELRADAVESFFPRGRADDRVVILALDEEFSERIALDPLTGYATFTTRLPAAGAQTGIVGTDVLETARLQLSPSVPIDETVVAIFEDANNVVLPIARGRVAEPRPGSSFPVFERVIPASVLAEAAKATGVASASDTPSTETRTVPLVVEATGAGGATRNVGPTLVPSVSVVALMRAEGLAPRVREVDGGLELGGRSVPTEGNHELRVSYTEELLPGGAQVVSAADVISDPDASRRLKGKTVVIGVTDENYAPLVPAPSGSGTIPAVFVEANALNTMLTEQYIEPVSDWTTVLGAALLAFVVALGVLVLPIWIAPVPALLLAGGWWLLARQRFDAGHPIDVVYPLVAIVVAFVAAFAWRTVRERRERRRVSQMFSRYVPDAVAKELLEPGQAEAAAAGQRLDIAILFCDLRGFTALSATMKPGDVRELLDVYYERVSQIVLDHGGTVLRFVGDEVLAVFGAPLPLEHHVAVALRCAIDILAATEALHAELAAEDLPPVEFGIGLHCGEVICAHVGSSAHRQYDIVGDAANIGARLCSAAGRRELVTSGEIMQAAAIEVDAEPMGVLELKGASGRIQGFRLRAPVPKADSTTSNASDGNRVAQPERS
jgi:adenylate cyclase